METMNAQTDDIKVKTVLELDLAGYSGHAQAFEENFGVSAVQALEDQIQSFVDRGLEQVGLRREQVLFGRSGDNAILVFENSAIMHRFAKAFQQAVLSHNRQKTVDAAKRWFRMGAATGPVLLPRGENRIVGSTVTRAVRLEAVANKGELVIDSATYNSLPSRLKKAYGDEEIMNGKRDEQYVGYRGQLAPQTSKPPKPKSPSREDAVATEKRPRLTNPYEFASIATGPTFKGRDEELGELLDSIQTGTHTAIFGLQRMGKTSLIEEGLKEALENNPSIDKQSLVVRIDLQRLGGDQVRYRDLLQTIIEAITNKLSEKNIGRALEDLRAITYELFSAGRYRRGDRTEFFAMFTNLLRGFSAAARRRIVLVIDEFSEVRKVIEQNKRASQHNPLRTGNLLPHDMYLDVPFLLHLGSMLKDPELRPKFTLVVVVRPFMAEFDEREELQLLKLMKPIMLYYLEESAAKALITEPLRGSITFEESVVDQLHHLTGGHPYLLQFILKKMVDKANRENRRNIFLDDVRTIERQMVTEGPAYDAQFEVLISDYSIAEVMDRKEALLGKGALAVIAKLGEGSPDRWVIKEHIVEMLLQHKLPVAKTVDLLDQLKRTKILEEQNREGHLSYRMAVPLLHKRFVCQNMYLKYFS